MKHKRILHPQQDDPLDLSGCRSPSTFHYNCMSIIKRRVNMLWTCVCVCQCQDLLPVVVEAVVFIGIEGNIFLTGEGSLSSIGPHSAGSDGNGIGIDNPVSVPVSDVLHVVFMTRGRSPADREKKSETKGIIYV